MKEIKRIEDIYPLTIIKMRYGGKIVLFQDEGDSSFVSKVQGNEEVFYNVDEWMKEWVSPCIYGIGETIDDAFQDFKTRYYSIEN